MAATVAGLITDNDETAYREEVRDLAMWCKDNNHSLNVIKSKEMMVDYRKRRTEHSPMLIDGAVVEQVESFKFLGVHITNKLTWSKHTKTVVKRARQNLFRRLKKFGMGPQILKRFYSCTINTRQLLGLRPQGTTEGSAYGPVHHWDQASCHPGPVCQRKAQKIVKDSSYTVFSATTW